MGHTLFYSKKKNCAFTKTEMKIFELIALGSVFAQDDFEPCEEGTVDVGNGICAEPDLVDFITEIENEIDNEEPAVPAIQARRFQMGTTGTEAGLNSIDNLRTKRRTQRLTLLATKVQGTRSGSKLKPREFLKMMNSYGCHCWTKPNTEDIGYKGKPLDSVDRACRTLKTCHTCISIDYSNCDPITTKYRAKVIKTANGGIDIQCMNQMNAKGTNNGHCKKNLCECDKQFAQQVADSWPEWTEKHWQLEKQKLFQQACVNPITSSGSRMVNAPGKPDQCCGYSYPHMKPFNSETQECNGDLVKFKNQL